MQKRNKKNELDEIVRLEKPILVSAGPGMGKTYTLAYKLKYLVETKRIDPGTITVITFTNEAAINMRRRISNKKLGETYIEPELQPTNICTMHKLGHRIIRDNLSKVNLQKAVKVMSSSYLRKILIKDCAQIIGAKRKDAADTITCRQMGKCIETNSVKCKICAEYENLLRRFNFVDHDDQILLACDILSDNSDILRQEQQKTEYLLVDEYQDINYAQWELIKSLSQGNEKNLFVVGDPYQSIYGFRGGSPEFIKNFVADYAPNAEMMRLRKSFRCPENIFKGSFYMVHKYNGGDHDFIKDVMFDEKSDAVINFHTFRHQNLEADFIARETQKIGPSYDVLILIPALDFAKPIKRALRKKYVDFFCDYDVERTELYILSILLEWLKETGNNFAFRILLDEIINRKLTDIPCEQAEIVGKDETRQRRENALKQISDFWRHIEKRKTLYLKLKTLHGRKPFEKLLDIVIGLRRNWESEEDVVSFLSTTADTLKLWVNKAKFSDELGSFIKEIKNIVTVGGGPNVRIMTMKKAKGLEADYVFMVGLENNLLPRKKASKADKEEDSRLLYVSMTRAKKELYLLHSEIRDRDITKVKIEGRSEFVDAIPSNYIKMR